jgi:IS30 family transposase
VGRPSNWMREVTGRAPLRSPGAPSHLRAREREFWAKISTGLLPSEAGVAIGVAPVMGSRWFRQSGGMSPYSWPAPSGRYLSLPEREEIGLRTGRALRMPRARSRRVPWAPVTADVLISERPAEAEDRAIPGHHERDLIIGINRSAIGTVVERATGFTTLVHLPREDGWREQPIVKNGPALSGYGAASMNRALAGAMSTLPAELKRSLTWDRGKEMSAHAQFAIDTGLKVYFADPHSPWQRGTNENTNGLLRQYFPKGTDLSRWSPDDLAAVAHALNTRPRKRLGWRTPAEALDEHLHSQQTGGVASTS